MKDMILLMEQVSNSFSVQKNQTHEPADTNTRLDRLEGNVDRILKLVEKKIQ